MQVQDAINQRDALIAQLKALVPADKLAEITESVTHVCDISFEAGARAARECLKRDQALAGTRFNR
jgi:hypothetical protein